MRARMEVLVTLIPLLREVSGSGVSSLGLLSLEEWLTPGVS